MFILDLDNQEPVCEVSFENSHYAGQTFVSTLEPCLVPTCECGSVHAVFRKKGLQTEDDIKILLDTYNNEVKPEIDKDQDHYQDFRQALEKELTEEKWGDLFQFYHTFKVIATEVIEPELLDVEFDEVSVETGVMESYNDILPYGLAVSLTLDEITYAVDTLFCLRTNCTCSGVDLVFHGEKEGEEILNMKSPLVVYDYKTGKYEVEYAGENTIHTPEQLVAALKNKIPELKSFLKNRHSRFKDIYTAYLKREGIYNKINKKSLRSLGTTIMAPQPKPAGRNDPCPCGSGKKYKKCCGA
jgi:hypothetical protein